MSTEEPIFSLFLKIQKVIRYVKLFGLSRTLPKIRVTKHNKASQGFDGDKLIVNESVANNDRALVSVIGYGTLAFANICFFLNKK